MGEVRCRSRSTSVSHDGLLDEEEEIEVGEMGTDPKSVMAEPTLVLPEGCPLVPTCRP